MRRFRLTCEYDGGAFQGWQVQRNARSVQGVIEEALQAVTGEAVRIHGAGRTDAGVHARGQVAQFDSGTALAPGSLCRALNAHLPADVSLSEIRLAPAGFLARRDALRKRYRYRILVRPSPSPLRRHCCWQLRGPLELAAMGEVADLLKGTHDFRAFRGAPKGPPPQEETRRTLDVLRVMRSEDEIHVVAEARSFLRYMVRNLVGTLVEVGLGRCEPAGVVALLAGGERAAAGPTAPAHGLCLEWIRYADADSGRS